MDPSPEGTENCAGEGQNPGEVVAFGVALAPKTGHGILSSPSLEWFGEEVWVAGGAVLHTPAAVGAAEGVPSLLGAVLAGGMAAPNTRRYVVCRSSGARSGLTCVCVYVCVRVCVEQKYVHVYVRVRAHRHV